MEKQYVYYQTVLQFRHEVLEDGKLSQPQTVRSWTTQINGVNSVSLQKADWRKKKEEKEKKQTESQQRIDSMKTVVGDVVYD